MDPAVRAGPLRDGGLGVPLGILLEGQLLLHGLGQGLGRPGIEAEVSEISVQGLLVKLGPRSRGSVGLRAVGLAAASLGLEVQEGEGAPAKTLQAEAAAADECSLGSEKSIYAGGEACSGIGEGRPLACESPWLSMAVGRISPASRLFLVGRQREGTV